MTSSPLLAFDDYPVHQATEPLRRVGSLHPRWAERWYFNLQRSSGELLGIVGGGFYPAASVLETYLCLLIDGTQYNLRAQHRTTDRMDLGVGTPIGFVIEEPLEHWRIEVRSDWVIGDLSFRASCAPFLFETFGTVADRVGEGSALDFDRVQHFIQPGEMVGHLQVDGHELVEVVRSFRDRTWGIRSRRPKLHNWYVLHLDDATYVTLIHQERADGTRMISEIARVHADGFYERAVLDDHQLRFDPSSRMLLHAEILAHTPSGEQVHIELNNLGEGIRLLGAGYDADQGEARLDVEASFEIWDLRDEQLRRRVGKGTIDSPVTAVVAWGREVPVRGFGVSESAIARSHYRYGASLD